ncbi:hypothetical protein ACSBL2_03560 [Pedobacter sp. AW31-3R]|uniref:hypothetical protein n=1 Tax=Pedobacter sp. AW31-3R TaxID=3445781 RepID=UPI003FA155B0
MIKIDPIQKIVLRSKIESSDKKFKTVLSEIGICYYSDYTLLEIPVISVNTYLTLDTGMNIIKSKSSLPHTTFRYFVFKNSTSEGLRYDSLAQIKGRPFSVDSLLKRKAYKDAIFYNPKTDKLISSKKSKINPESLVEVYSRLPAENRYQDTLKFHYCNEMNNVRYSFSNTLDQHDNGKIYKIDNTFSTVIPNSGNPGQIQMIRMVFEMHKDENSDMESIKNYFEKFIAEKEN